jgi:4-hydroxybenzoate polyprenyltransferase
LLFGYSFTKYFTWGCHFVLWLVQLFAPICAWLAVTDTLSLAPIFLGLALGCTIAANDILYACQDIDFDRKEGLYSIPACFGIQKAEKVAQITHAVSIASLIAVGALLDLSLLYFVGVAAVGGIFIATYLSDEPLEVRFSRSNTYAGITLLAFTLGDFSWHAL